MLKPKVKPPHFSNIFGDELHIFPILMGEIGELHIFPGPACAAFRGLRRAGGVAEAAEVSRDGGAACRDSVAGAANR